MARRDILERVSDSFLKTIETHVKTGYGSLKFAQKDKKTYIKVFFKDQLIYGVESSVSAPKIVTRIVTNEIITDANRTQVLNKFENSLEDFAVIKYVLDYQLFPERPLAVYIKDFFFDVLDTLYLWEDVTVEWKQNDRITIGNGLTINPADPAEILTRIKERINELNNTVAQAWSIHPKELNDIVFVKNFDVETKNYTQTLLLSLPDGTEPAIGDVADYFGLPVFNTKLAVYELWLLGAVDVIHPAGIRYSNRSETEIRKTASPTENIVSVPNSKSIPLASETNTPSDNPFLKQILAHGIQEETELPFPTPLNNNVSSSEDEGYIVEDLTEEIFDNEMDDEYEPFDSYIEDDIVEEIIEETVEDDTYNEHPDDFYEYKNLIEDTPPTLTAPPTTPTETYEEDIDMTDASGLKAMALQMKTMLTGIKERIQVTKKTISDRDTEITSTTQKRRTLISELRALDAALEEAKTEKAKAESELAELETEFNEFTQLFQ